MGARMATAKTPPPPERPDSVETQSVELRAEEVVDGALCLLVSSEAGVRVIRVDRGELILGRDAGADIQIDHASVSRQHARLSVRHDAVTITDLESRNGTRIGGKRATPGAPIPVAIGLSFELGLTTVVLQRAVGFLPPGASGTFVAAKPRTTDAGTDGLVVRDPAMARLYGLLDVVAPSSIAVLILGETGVGKEVFAEALHQRSSRAGKRFVQINCASFPETMLEAELFGYEAGAFTGSRNAKPGLFEMADGGTAFLDEVGEIPMGTQAKLLRALESGEILRLGSVRPRRVDVRFVSATNRNLRALILEKRFRSDLFFRLKGMTVRIPPLRERRADILPLATTFLSRASARQNRPLLRLTEEASSALERHFWPGNVRELRQEIERLVAVCPGPEVTVGDLELEEEFPFGGEEDPRPSDAEADGGPDATLKIASVGAPRKESIRFKAPIADVTRDMVLEALNRAAGNQSEAARALGISRRALIYRIEQFGIARPRRR
jgi:DNA-binding NtrC family response regulator